MMDLKTIKQIRTYREKSVKSDKNCTSKYQKSELKFFKSEEYAGLHENAYDVK